MSVWRWRPTRQGESSGVSDEATGLRDSVWSSGADLEAGGCGEVVMEWREQSSVSCEEAFVEAQRWIEAVTKKTFGSRDFRSALENGVLLCDLINRIKPGLIKKVNRLPTPIAGLDNLNVFLKACGKLGLKEAQLFHPGDLQDLSSRVTVQDQESSRRLKNVVITIYWLGRSAQCERLYDGPYLNFKAFEGLLGTALYKALQESPSQRGSNTRDSGFGDHWSSEREELEHLRGGGGHRRDNSLDSLESLSSHNPSNSSDATVKGSSEGGCSDTEVDSALRMAENKDSLSYRRSVTLTPKVSTQFNQFLPTKDKQSSYVPAPLRKKRAERNEDSRRSWANPMHPEEDGSLTRSKSTGDIPVNPTVLRQTQLEELQRYREKIKQSEDKWQDDLSKWKSRRRSVNSDIVKKKEEREKIEQITFGGEHRRSKTFKEMQEQRENRRNNSIGGRLSSLYTDDEEVFEKPVTSPQRRSLPPRSFTIDTPYTSEPAQKEVKPVSPKATSRRSLTSSSEDSDTEETPTQLPSVAAPTSRPRSPSPQLRSSQTTRNIEGTSTTISTSTVLSTRPVLREQEPLRPLPRLQTDSREAPSSGSLYKQQPQNSTMEPKLPAASRVSASLPRTYQITDSARLVTPRPFGMQSSRITSLPRTFGQVDDPSKRLNGNAAKKSTVPSRYHQYMTPEDEVQSPSSSSSEDEEEQEKSATKSISPAPPQAAVAPLKKASEETCQMRISLNQKPNSSRDFGFHAAWDSTGARVSSIQPGSPAEIFQLQPGDEVLTVNGHQVAEMSYTDWKASMEAALQEGSLVMDVRRHGQKTWDRDQPSPPFKSHKTINLTSLEHPMLVGFPDSNAINSLDFTSRISRETASSTWTPSHSVIDVASNGVNGGFRDDPVNMRNKESETISLKNLKRRSEFFEKGGPDSSMPEIPVPAITPSSRWSWDPEEERRRQEKWQKEQERLLQEKYKRDQEKLQEEWLRAQQEIASSSKLQQPGSLELRSSSVSPLSSLSPVSQSWEEEEKLRKEEQERQQQAEEKRRQEEEERHRREELERQRQVEERRKREEEQRELQRQQEERRKREQQEEERKEREAEELRWQQRREEERQAEERKRQAAAEKLRREREKVLAQQQWNAGSHSFSNWESTLSISDRQKSKSSPHLDGDDRTRRVTGVAAVDRRSQQSLTPAELERQQILNEMKKKNSLLTDNSWIRQRSASSKDSDSPPMRRGESLDHLETSYNSWRSSWTPRSNSQIPNYARPHSALSGSTSHYGGGSGARQGSPTLTSSYSLGSLRGSAGRHASSWGHQSPSPSPSSPSPATSPEPPSEAGGSQRSRSVSGKKICTFCDTPLGKGAAMIIESLGLCYHLGCFKCIDCHADLGGSEAGAEVRIRNKQLYCNLCYMRFKTGQPTSM
ncbi:LIM domain only protein 7-like isoform X3 [Synchiropus splendidus]|uniref:LIM domain only protein 7-like isoform X3 n=1 Tax=Synchiropus splendidus TaxID=270530 RepID=UPI00237E23FB|nr:LIM domain only protein 7-like isoform X3 [Synchiropus splendidus]